MRQPTPEGQPREGIKVPNPGRNTIQLNPERSYEKNIGLLSRIRDQHLAEVRDATLEEDSSARIAASVLVYGEAMDTMVGWASSRSAKNSEFLQKVSDLRVIDQNARNAFYDRTLLEKTTQNPSEVDISMPDEILQMFQDANCDRELFRINLANSFLTLVDKQTDQFAAEYYNQETLLRPLEQEAHHIVAGKWNQRIYANRAKKLGGSVANAASNTAERLGLVKPNPTALGSSALNAMKKRFGIE